MGQPVKIVDVNSVSYLYGKLKSKIDEFQDESKSKLDQFQSDTETKISKLESDTEISVNEAIAAANAATEKANIAANYADSVANGAEASYATKDELKDAIGGITSFEMETVDALPDTGKKGTIYLVPASDGSGDDIYNEYIWIEGQSKFEKIGTTRIDLSPYLKSADASNTYLGKTDTAAAASKTTNALTISLNGTSQGAFDGSAVKSIDITPANIGAAASSHGTHVSYSTTAPAANGTASVGSASTVARSDHVHPLQTSVSGSSGSCTGNAATATKLATARSIKLSGAVTGSVSFNGSADVTIATTVNYGTSAPSTLTTGSVYYVYES